jgi:pimeloyl-ACP methyl ester carboxylesterase
MNRRIRNTLGLISVGLAVAGGAATAIVRSRNARRPLPLNHLGGVQRRVIYKESELFVTELGSGPPLVLVHGLRPGASSYEFRRLAPLLATSHRVIAFDFLGCGLSDHPDELYDAEFFVEQLTHVINECTAGPLTLVASSYGSAYALQVAARMSERIAAVIAISPDGVVEKSAKPKALRQALQLSLRAPGIGDAAYGALTTNRALRASLLQLYVDKHLVTPEMLEHYSTVAHIPGAERIIAALAGGALVCELGEELPILSTPVLLLRGRETEIAHEDIDMIISLGNKVACVTFEACGAMPHEELPQATAEAIYSFLSRQ